MIMSLDPRMSHENNYVRPGIGSGSDAVRPEYEAETRADIVQSNKGVDGAAEPALDLAVIEERARAARAAWIGSKLKPYYEALLRKFARGGQGEMEEFLAASQSLADLEERIRRYERVQSRCY